MAKLKNRPSSSETDENLGLGVYVVCIWVLLTVNIAGHFGVIWCTLTKLDHSSSQSETDEKLGLGALCSSHMGTFLL